MDPVSPLPVLVSFSVALLTSFVLFRMFGGVSRHGRYASIDGLRGYLAFSVFLHHSCIWYFYLRNKQWTAPPSNIYNNLGQTSVVFFFMITGFLFFSKLMDARKKNIDWFGFFFFRFFRIVPLYGVAVAGVVILAFYATHWFLNQSFPVLTNRIIRWLAFGSPNINEYEKTALIEGVTWTLRYESIFYFSLPLLSLLTKANPSTLYIIVSFFLTAVGIFIWRPEFEFFLPFLGGIFASILIRFELFRRFSRGNIATAIVIFNVSFVFCFFQSPYNLVSLVLLSLAFSIIACGNTIFGSLVTPGARLLGEISYSIYLLHSMLLFLVFEILFGDSDAKTISPMMHWVVILGITPVLVMLSFWTFRFVEHPAMKSAPTFLSWLRSRRPFGHTANTGVAPSPARNTDSINS